MELIAMLALVDGVRVGPGLLLLHQVAAKEIVMNVRPFQIATAMTRIFWKTLASVGQ